MKKLWILPGIMMFVVCISGFSHAEEMVDPAQYQKQGPYVVGLSTVSLDNSFKIALVAEFQNFCDTNTDLIEEYHITEAKGQIARQIADIEELIAKDVEILLVTATSPTAISPVIRKATAAGILTVSFDNTVQTDEVTIKVEADENSIGFLNMTWLAKKLDGKGKIVMLGGGKGTSSAHLRWDGAKQVLKEYPEIEVVGETWVNWAFDKSKEAMANFLSVNPEISGVWTDGGDSAQGALAALIEANRVVPVVGTASNGFAKLWLAQMKDNHFEAFAATNPPYCSVTALKLALELIQGKSVPRYIKTKPAITNNNNIADLAKPELTDNFWVDTLLNNEQNEKLWSDKQ